MKVFGLWERLTRIKFFDGKAVTVEPLPQTGVDDKVINIPDMATNATQELILSAQAQTLSNKTIDADQNTITNIENADIKVGAAIDKAKISGTALTAADVGTVTSTIIANETIVNADIALNAAIAGTKISPDFGSQNVQTTGNITTGGNLTANGAGSKLVVDVSTASEAVYIRQLGTGNALVVLDQDEGVGVDSSVTFIDASGNVGIGLAASATLTEKVEVSGNIKASGGVTANSLTLSGTSITLSANAVTLGDSNDTVTIPGNLTVQGTTTTVDTTNLLVKDNNITINNGGTDITANGAGISIEGTGDSVLATITYDHTSGGNPQRAFTLGTTGALKVPTGTTAERPTSSASGMVRYNSTTSAFEGYDGIAWSGLGGGGSIVRVTQANTYTAADIGRPLYLNGANYDPAIATAANTAEVAGVLSKVIDASTFEICLGGEVTAVGANLVEGGGALSPGETYFLSTITPGKITTTEPSVVGYISKPVGIARSSTALDFFNMRGTVVGAANARTTIALANSSTTSVQNASSYDAGELAGWVFIDATTDRRFYIQAQFAKNGAGTDYNLSYQTTGDTPPAGFSLGITSGGIIQATLPSIAGFSSAHINYALNAPAVGASLPLSVDSTALNVVDSAPLSYRNRIINGGMQVCQRYAVNTNVGLGSAAYIVDRFAVREATPASANAQWSTVAPSGFTNSLAYLITATGTPTTNDIAGIEHKIEGLNVADLDWGTANAKTVTLSFWARSSVVGTYGGLATNGAETRAYGFTYSILAQDTWEYKTVTIPGDTGGAGTWLKDNGIGLRITWDMGSGSGKRIAGGSWGTISNFEFGVNSTVILGQTASASFYLTGVQLEVGSKASAFERRPYSEELVRCMRYFIKQDVPVFQNCVYYSGGFQNGGSVGMQFPVTLRAIPAVTVSYVNVDNTASVNVSALNNSRTTQGIRYSFTVANAAFPYCGFNITSNVDAEL
jgi:hypothetical protein